mmetsp:Transcript_26819/g.54894  ORF Transcript_26819/g.54894 Transcript_26819/m.54894 type:complete len:203 (+) Transcript_26819:51-659(+)
MAIPSNVSAHFISPFFGSQYRLSSAIIVLYHYTWRIIISVEETEDKESDAAYTHQGADGDASNGPCTESPTTTATVAAVWTVLNLSDSLIGAIYSVIAGVGVDPRALDILAMGTFPILSAYTAWRCVASLQVVLHFHRLTPSLVDAVVCHGLGVRGKGPLYTDNVVGIHACVARGHQITIATVLLQAGCRIERPGFGAPRPC